MIFRDISILVVFDEIRNPCNPSPCGSNAVCKQNYGAGSCACIQNYYGDPYVNCRPECVQNTDCAYDKYCMNNKCMNPCIGTCGLNAKCDVVHHMPICSCPQGTTGNAINVCHEIPQINYGDTQLPHPCSPSPCGAFSICREINSRPVCSCQANYMGAPPNCHPECVVSSACAPYHSCVNERCVDPCPGTCGLNAQCHVINHSPLCSCNPGYTGDPFYRCTREQSKNIFSQM